MLRAFGVISLAVFDGNKKPREKNKQLRLHKRDNHFTLYQPQFEIMPFRRSLEGLTMDLSAGGRTSEEERKIIVGTVYHYSVFIPKTYYGVCSMITCCGEGMCKCVMCVCF